MALVRDVNIAVTLFIAVMLRNKFYIAEIEALWLSRIKILGAHFTSESSVFSVIAE